MIPYLWQSVPKCVMTLCIICNLYHRNDAIKREGTKAWTQAFEDNEFAAAYNVVKDRGITVKELQLKFERVSMIEHPAKQFVTGAEVQDMLADGVEKTNTNIRDYIQKMQERYADYQFSSCRYLLQRNLRDSNRNLVSEFILRDSNRKLVSEFILRDSSRNLVSEFIVESFRMEECVCWCWYFWT